MAFGDMLVLIGLLCGPAVVVVVGSLTIGWLEAKQDLPGRRPPATWDADRAGRDVPVAERSDGASMLWALPYAALTAGLILAPVVIAVWSVVADAPAVGYLATVGFAIGARAVDQLVRASAPSGGRFRWTRAPGVLLAAIVGFLIALVGFLGTELAAYASIDLGGNARVVVPLAVGVLLGALGVAARRKRRRTAPPPPRG